MTPLQILDCLFIILMISGIAPLMIGVGLLIAPTAKNKEETQEENKFSKKMLGFGLAMVLIGFAGQMIMKIFIP